MHYLALKIHQMIKTTGYFEDDAYSKMQEIAKKERRTFPQVLNIVIEKGLSAPDLKIIVPDKEVSKSGIQLAEHLVSKIAELAIINKKTIDEMVNSMVESNLKERERQREKNAKRVRTKQ